MMTKELKVFNYEGAQVRTFNIDGEVWFVAKDVCDILELGNVSKAIQELDEDERSSLTISEGTSRELPKPKGIGLLASLATPCISTYTHLCRGRNLHKTLRSLFQRDVLTALHYSTHSHPKAKAFGVSRAPPLKAETQI